MADEDLKWLGLSNLKIAETLKNKALTQELLNIVSIAKKEMKSNDDVEPIPKQKATQLYQLGTRIKPQCTPYIHLIISCIMNDKIRNDQQLLAAIDYVLTHSVTGVDEDRFLEACGVGVVITSDQIEDEVNRMIEKYKPELLNQRYSFNTGRILADVRSALMWADGLMIKREVDLQVMLLLGPKREHELIPQKKKAKKLSCSVISSPTNVTKKVEISQLIPEITEDSDCALSIEDLMRKKVHFHTVGENYKTDGYIITPHTTELLKRHVANVNGKVVTRFPPEPNGVLHIGHAKAININFGYAKALGGICYLRFDDTNPEKEEEQFFTAIEDIVHWLGYKPAKVTHSSDYFQQLYEWAVELIKKDLAYVCHQTVEEMRGFNVKSSPWRNRPLEESLQLFQDMRRGKFSEGDATLRLKTVLEEGKVDPVAYRIKYSPHHRTGNKWCIYPTYDYTHCLCDSIENITHSLCTKEFQSRRSSYYWLCNALDIYCPVQWEYGRLNVDYTVVSKRKIKTLIEMRIVRNWDDPRLFTLTALRRRGIPAEAINNFVARLGITTAQMTVDPKMLDAVTREYLNVTAPRTMAVMDPLKLTIINFNELKLPSVVVVPDFPSDTNSESTHNIALENVIYIERSDYRHENVEKGYRRLTKNQAVGLKFIGIALMVTQEIKDDTGCIKELLTKAFYPTEQSKPKAFIHWVSKPLRCEVRLYGQLFYHKNPENPTEVPNGFLSDCNMDSLKVVYPVLIDAHLSQRKVFEKFQFERVGFFSIDPDSTPKKLVFNRTVLLKEDSGKL